MSKVYLSFLGTNDYLPCTYYQGDQSRKNIRFVQEATLAFHCRDWTAEDRILIFLTDEALKANWKDNGHMDRRTGQPLDRKGLERCIQDLKLTSAFTPVPICTGKSETEIWEIFDTMFSHLNSGDEVIFDITHALRSIPMLAIVVLNYAKVLKNIRILGIYYGAFEVLGSLRDAENLKVNKRKVPVFDLTAFDLLTDWAFAIDRFTGSGDAEPAKNLALKTLKPVLAATQGKDATASALRGFTFALSDFTKSISTCRGPDIPHEVLKLKERLRACADVELIRPLLPLLRRIEKRMADFQDNPVLCGIEAAQWCLDHNLIQQGYTILQEFLISHFILQIGEDPMVLINRELVNQAVYIHINEVQVRRWNPKAAENAELVRRFLDYFDNVKPLIYSLRSMGQIRNDLNHAGFRDPRMKAKDFEENLRKTLQEIKAFFGLNTE